MKHTTFAIFLNLIPIFFTLALSKQCNPYDENILLQLKAQLGNPSSLVWYWNRTTDCCSDWGFEISCDENGHVTRLILGQDDDITGPIPPIIGRLTFLRHLGLWNQNISGPIPLAVCNLTNLDWLTIRQTSMSGPIPKCLGGLKNLTDLAISYNKGVTGPIPDSLTNLTKLQYLQLEANNLSGPIPGSVNRMRTLEWFNVESNRITGRIPPSLALIRTLGIVIMGNNLLSGSIPNSFGLFKNPITLDLHGNRLSGPVPKSLGWVQAYTIDLSSNRLVGNPSFLLETYKNVTFGRDIDLSNNKFKFNFSNVQLFKGLRSLNISHNMIYGSIPLSMGQINAKKIDVSSNKLTGDASLLFGRGKTRARSIKLSQNGFKFDLSDIYFPLDLVQLNISHNMIYGSLPKQLGQLSFKTIDVSFNQLCGPIPNSKNLTRFSPVRFAHNKCLCGHPLRACK